MGVRYLVGEANTVQPTSPNSALPVLGTPDAVAPSAGPLLLAAGQAVRTTITGGALRAVNVPLTSSGLTSITVTVSNAAGQVIASNRRSMAAGTALIPVPLAADSPDQAARESGRLTVTVTSSADGVTASRDAAGAIRVQPVRPSAANSRVRMVYAAENLMIYERLDYVPRIHWADTAQVIPDAAARLAAVAKSPLQAEQVILAQPPATTLGSTGTAPRSFRVVEDSGDTVKVDVTTDSAGYVVVTDNLENNFTASVDGHRAVLVSADYAGGAVLVPPGTHRVTLAYTPAGRATGVKISAVSAVALVLIAVPTAWWRRLRRRRGRATPEPAGSEPS
jgi:hypothetical protein